ncbi:hypothetical protein WME98_24135 [Sorangium sp. So ce296]|uniref:hypothetical protein n=1 Tax=Sorangium sp. So ce296 TaxID=3133296 RepID=UPI003F6431A7
MDASLVCEETPSFSVFAVMMCDDADGDGVCDVEDNCPGTANGDQQDRDGGAIGSACDDEEETACSGDDC